jgi:hypothetical protein
MKQGQDLLPTVAFQPRFRIRYYEAPRKLEGAGFETGNISFCCVLMFHWAKT